MKQLMAYQTLIVGETRRCGGKGWKPYNSMFHQQMAGDTSADWSKLNTFLYAVTFLAQAGKGRSCSLCTESDHSDEECGLAPRKPATGGSFHSGQGSKHYLPLPTCVPQVRWRTSHCPVSCTVVRPRSKSGC